MHCAPSGREDGAIKIVLDLEVEVGDDEEMVILSAWMQATNRIMAAIKEIVCILAAWVVI